jgi:DNA polymerase III delta subunit
VRGDRDDGDLDAAHPAPCYLLFGQETFEAREFIDRLRERWLGGAAAESGFERFYVPETGWRDIVDSARTTASLFADWRILVVKVGGKRAKGEDEEGDAGVNESNGRRAKGGEEALKDYLAAPSERTVIVIVVDGPVRKTHPLVKALAGLPRATAVVKELRPLKDREARAWLDERADGLGKRLDPDARDRLIEVSGLDRAVLAGELDKLALFVDERKVIKLDDIEGLSGWVKTFEGYEIENALLSVDVGRTLVVLDRLFRDGHRPEEMVSQMTRFLRDLLMAKLRLRDGLSRREVFSEIKPQISASYQKLYAEISGKLFGLVERLGFEDLRDLLGGLRRIDERIKTTDNLPQALLERFVVEYAAVAGRRGATSPGRRTGARPAG